MNVVCNLTVIIIIKKSGIKINAGFFDLCNKFKNEFPGTFAV